MNSSPPDIDAFRAAALRCPLPAAIEIIGEKWAFLILRGALNGLRHFEQFQAGLGIARNILSNRLGRMVEAGILQRSPDPIDGRKVIYALTEKGEALLPVVVALRQWGEHWGHGTPDVLPRRPARRQADPQDPHSRRGRPRTRPSRLDVARSRDRRGVPARRSQIERAARRTALNSALNSTLGCPSDSLRVEFIRSRRPTGSGAAGRRR